MAKRRSSGQIAQSRISIARNTGTTADFLAARDAVLEAGLRSTNPNTGLIDQLAAVALLDPPTSMIHRVVSRVADPGRNRLTPRGSAAGLIIGRMCGGSSDGRVALTAEVAFDPVDRLVCIGSLVLSPDNVSLPLLDGGLSVIGVRAFDDVTRRDCAVRMAQITQVQEPIALVVPG